MLEETPSAEPVGGDSYSQGGEAPKPSEERMALVKRVIKDIKDDKLFHDKAFQRMKRDMQVATWGAEKAWLEGKNYTANICGRHAKQRTSALYAKNPKVKASRPETLDFAIWDETPESLQMAVQAQQLAAATPPVTDELGQPVVDPAVAQAAMQAQELLQDVQTGMARRQQLDKIAKTLEILYSRAMREQKPVSFKTAAKAAVRRTVVACVSYCELNFQRETGPRPATVEKLADHQARIAHLEQLAKNIAEDDAGKTGAELAELNAAAASLMSEPEIVLREGLIFDFPAATKVIPDRKCKSLVGFIGAGRVTIEYDYTVGQIKEMFKVDVTKGEKSGASDGTKTNSDALRVVDAKEADVPPSGKDGEVKQVWKCYDKTAGLVYYVVEGYCDFLREPAKPDVFVEDFWPIYPLVFNDVENEDELFPPSDISLMLDVAREHNRSRQGLREHRNAARPRYVARQGSMDQEDKNRLANAEPFTVTDVKIQPNSSIEKELQVVPVPGVDPNLYDTSPFFADAQLVVGASEPRFGGVSKATATEAAIAEGSTTETDASNVEDLDDWLTAIARAGGQILLKEMSPETVQREVGVGAVWPDATLAEIAGEIFLEIEAGSTGKPNQAMEIDNWSKMLPFLIQMPDITPGFLARETLRRLDDRMDFTKAIVEGALSIAAQNMASKAPPSGGVAEDPGNEPGAQGDKGGANAPKVPEGQGGPGGGEPAYGSNQR